MIVTATLSAHDFPLKTSSSLPKSKWLPLAGLVVAILTTGAETSGANLTNTPLPFQTGTHQQWVRKFHTTANGLPGNSIRAVAVLADGTVLAGAGKGLARLEGEAWQVEAGPVEVTALLALPQAGEALAGATNGVWLRSNGAWQQEPGGPAKVIAFAQETEGTAWALSPSGVWRREKGWILVHTLDDEHQGRARSILPVGPEEVFLATEVGLFGLMGKRKYWLPLEVRPGGLPTANTRDLARFDGTHFLIATDKGLCLTDGLQGWQLFTGAQGLPILDLRRLAVSAQKTVWIGSEEGLMRWDSGQWSYLASKRWLPDDRITALATAPAGGVWAGTPQGLSQIFPRTLTLEEKAAIYQKDLESRDRRHGFVTLMQLKAPGVTEGASQEVSDNDGLWTALYVAAQSFRYSVTKSAEAKAQAWRSMQAILRLESITGIPGFPARAIRHVDEPNFDERSLRASGEWHASTVEKGWWWKGETSSDELDGHYFAWQIFSDLAASEEEKKAVSATCQRVTDHILDHGYYLVDLDGKPTTWGVWAPEKLNDDPKWWAERGLNSLEMLSHLKVASHLTGNPRYEKAYSELVSRHHYAINTLEAKSADGVSHDDQLLFLSYYPLLRLERDPGLGALYLSSLRRSWAMERIEANPLWNFIFGACAGEPCDAEAAVRSLREMPLDMILWKNRNSHRADIMISPEPGRRGQARALKPLPWSERTIHKWDKDPYDLDGGSDMGEGDPTIWLLPYWMGRHHRLIE